MTAEQNSRVVLVNGATGGLGPAVVKVFTDEGARLVLSARTQEDLEHLAAECGLTADQVLLQPLNILDPDAVQSGIAAAEKQFGRIDVVVQVTGAFKMLSATEMQPKDWNLLIGLNLSAAFFVAHSVLPGMLQRQSGKLIFVSSRDASRAVANLSGYSAGKSGLEALVRSLAEETRQHGVNVNAVAPSVIDTPANRKAMPDADYAAWVTPESIADVIKFLTSDAARDLHGAILPIAGRS